MGFRAGISDGGFCHSQTMVLHETPKPYKSDMVKIYTSRVCKFLGYRGRASKLLMNSWYHVLIMTQAREENEIIVGKKLGCC